MLADLSVLVGEVMDLLQADDESPIDEWISVGYRRGVMTGVTASLMTMAVLAAIWWMR